jgi:cytochrome c
MVTLLACGCTDDARDAGSDSEQAQAAAERRRSNRGELLSLACQACHALTREGGPDIGPRLYGVFGRPAASVPGFEYSAALRDADFLWSAAELDQWLQAPEDFLPGTTMVFAGYGDAEDRRALIEWLQEATAVESD